MIEREDSIMKRKRDSPEQISKKLREADEMPAVGSTIGQIGTNKKKKPFFLT